MASHFTENLPPDIAFSSQLHDICITTDANYLIVDIYVNTVKVYSTDLFACNGKIQLYDIRSIAEPYLQENNFSVVYIEAYDADRTQENYCISNNPSVLYCDKEFKGNAETFISENFLSTLSARKISKQHSDKISLALFANENPALKYQITYLNQGSATPLTKELTIDTLTSTSNTVMTLDFSYESALSALTAAEPGEHTLLSCTVVAGNRCLTYFFSETNPSYAFNFRNCFYCQELLELDATTTVKSNIDSSIAISNSKFLTYDQNLYRDHETNSAPLTSKEAIWIDQFLNSHDIRILDEMAKSADGTYPNIIITDSNCDVSDNDKEMPHIKFTWRYTDMRPMLYDVAPANLFTKEYNQSFT